MNRVIVAKVRSSRLLKWKEDLAYHQSAAQYCIIAPVQHCMFAFCWYVHLISTKAKEGGGVSS